ncbi:hypothetical protein Poli38472_004946 [Pythium oligandrum]|uniref:Uncharacterized protein n=1 Tax=Pythium oligandrum TaxID=41045 RepID=A0A8K1CCM2_PYTOL|nr:hypothetical protein Poli38472_004946 [Pythium oligandrum]|eukprot:TMW59877.1 hypothetical protein Poli38472_004946 [Pythium oligandrum]
MQAELQHLRVLARDLEKKRDELQKQAVVPGDKTWRGVVELEAAQTKRARELNRHLRARLEEHRSVIRHLRKLIRDKLDMARDVYASLPERHSGPDLFDTFLKEIHEGYRMTDSIVDSSTWEESMNHRAWQVSTRSIEQNGRLQKVIVLQNQFWYPTSEFTSGSQVTKMKGVTKVPVRNPSRERMQAELRHLRELVRELEQKRDALEAPAPGLGEAWRKVAEYEAEMCKHAEELNVELRARLEEQIAVLERLHELIDEQMKAISDIDAGTPLKYSDPGVFERFLDDIHKGYEMTDSLSHRLDVIRREIAEKKRAQELNAQLRARLDEHIAVAERLKELIDGQLDTVRDVYANLPSNNTNPDIFSKFLGDIQVGYDTTDSIVDSVDWGEDNHLSWRVDIRSNMHNGHPQRVLELQNQFRNPLGQFVSGEGDSKSWTYTLEYLQSPAFIVDEFAAHAT